MRRKDGARAIIEHNSGILLVQEGRNGPFGLPGGKPDQDEGYLEAAIRETEEETGLRVRLLELVGFFNEISTAHGKNVTDAVFTAEAIAGQIMTSRGHPVVDYFHPRKIRAMHARGQMRNERHVAAIQRFVEGQRFPLSAITIIKPVTEETPGIVPEPLPDPAS